MGGIMKEAKKILTKLSNRKTIETEEFEYAKQKGLMFPYTETPGHADCLKRISDVVNKITPEEVANAFLYSLSTRQLEYRSALGSYWYAKAIVPHEHDEIVKIDDSIGRVHCDICQWQPYRKKSIEYKDEYNVLNSERYVYGGVRHTYAVYALFDLEEYLKLPKVEHTKEDEVILAKILKLVEELDPKAKAGALQKAITAGKFLKSNKAEVDTIIDILGICGILENEEHQCYDEGFMDCIDRNPPELTNDYSYPVNWWMAKDGVNRKRLSIVFDEDFQI